MRTLYFCPVASSSFFLLFSSPNLSRRWLDVYHTTWRGLSASLERRYEMCCTWLDVNTERKKSPKIRYLGTITQLCWAVSLQLRHVSTIGKKLVKQQYLLHMSSLWPTNSWDRFGSLEHSSKFQRISRLGSVSARHSSSGRQSNFSALNRGCHLYLAGRPSHWALAHILVVSNIHCSLLALCICLTGVYLSLNISIDTVTYQRSAGPMSCDLCIKMCGRFTFGCWLNNALDLTKALIKWLIKDFLLS